MQLRFASKKYFPRYFIADVLIYGAIVIAAIHYFG
jgi:hypothetical protein